MLAQCYLLRSDFAWFALPVPLLLPFPRPCRWTARRVHHHLAFRGPQQHQQLPGLGPARPNNGMGGAVHVRFSKGVCFFRHLCLFQGRCRPGFTGCVCRLGIGCFCHCNLSLLVVAAAVATAAARSCAVDVECQCCCRCYCRRQRFCYTWRLSYCITVMPYMCSLCYFRSGAGRLVSLGINRRNIVPSHPASLQIVLEAFSRPHELLRALLCVHGP